MVGFPTRLLIAQRVLDRLATEDPAEAARLEANRPWFMLGALGPALGDFVPHEPGGPGGSERSPYYKAWREMLKIAVGDPRPPTPLPGLASTLWGMQGALASLVEKIRDHDLVGLGQMYLSGQLDWLEQAKEDLKGAQKYLREPTTLEELNKTIATSRPRIDDPFVMAPPNRWTGREYLHWKRTGEFATRLVADAEVSGDERFLAYARGWQVGYATLVCGSGFVASITRSVYRTHWWRSRWIANFVDTWVWGYYNQTAAAFGPANYASWPSLCSAGLHRWIQVGEEIDSWQVASSVVAERPLPAALPSEFAAYWIGAWTATYASGDPTARPGGDPLFTPERLQVGYVMTSLVLWFQTSGEVVGCNSFPGPPPAACGPSPKPPDWLDPSKINPATGEPYVAPTPRPALDPDEDELICGIVAGLVGAALAALGMVAVGIALLKEGIRAAVYGGTQLNWNELECQLYWTRVHMFNSLGSLHRTLVLGGFQHPYAPELAAAEATANFGGTITFPTAAAKNCRSRAIEGPRQPWNFAASPSHAPPPGEPIEQRPQMLWSDEWWPSAIVDDDAENPIQASILDPPAGFDSGAAGSFGPAVQNALAILGKRPASLPNWNLDSDRGHGWLTWELRAPYASPVQAFPES